MLTQGITIRAYADPLQPVTTPADSGDHSVTRVGIATSNLETRSGFGLYFTGDSETFGNSSGAPDEMTPKNGSSFKSIGLGFGHSDAAPGFKLIGQFIIREVPRYHANGVSFEYTLPGFESDLTQMQIAGGTLGLIHTHTGKKLTNRTALRIHPWNGLYLDAPDQKQHTVNTNGISLNNELKTKKAKLQIEALVSHLYAGRLVEMKDELTDTSDTLESTDSPIAQKGSGTLRRVKARLDVTTGQNRGFFVEGIYQDNRIKYLSADVPADLNSDFKSTQLNVGIQGAF